MEEGNEQRQRIRTIFVLMGKFIGKDNPKIIIKTTLKHSKIKDTL